jgi:uncharacterized protein (DUF924 family)
MNYSEVLDFWFETLSEKDWYSKSDEMDLLIKDKFQETHSKAIAGELFSWRTSIKGRLAEIIVLDQFSRNMFRNSPKSFSSDAQALTLSQEAIASGLSNDLNPKERAFLFMPFMHSESLNIHEEAVKIFSVPGLEDSLEFEMMHKKIIEKFGRYPHRNNILNRESTQEEIDFLSQPGSSF